jgi:hypothetical protein
MATIEEFLATHCVKTDNKDDRIKTLDALELYNQHYTPITATKFGTALNKYLKDNGGEIKKWKIDGHEARGFFGYKTKVAVQEAQAKALKERQEKVIAVVKNLIEVKKMLTDALKPPADSNYDFDWETFRLQVIAKI